MNETVTWKGYTLHELRLQRIVTETKIEIVKARVMRDGNKIKETSVPAPFSAPLFKKIAGALDYADYMIMAFTIGRKVMRLFRRKKKK